MVHLVEHIKQLKSSLDSNNLGSLAYFYLKDKPALSQVDPNAFSGLDLVSAKGYLSLPIEREERQKILKPGFKGIDISTTIYKLIGAYLADDSQVAQKLDEKFEETTLKNQYLISRFVEGYREKLKEILKSKNVADCWPFKFVEGLVSPNSNDAELLSEFLKTASDPIDLLILEDLHSKFLEYQIPDISLIDKSAYEIFIGVIENFHNAIKKIVLDRRKGHDAFKVEDEYDVQDLLYVILKSIFPLLKEEDPTPRVGIKSNKIDLILREYGILLEVKMIKKSDSNEKNFVEQLKNDIQSYHNCQWLKHLLCLVYDPYSKTKDRQNFYDLAGDQTIKGRTFTVRVIVNPA